MDGLPIPLLIIVIRGLRGLTRQRCMCRRGIDNFRDHDGTKALSVLWLVIK